MTRTRLWLPLPMDRRITCATAQFERGGRQRAQDAEGSSTEAQLSPHVSSQAPSPKSSQAARQRSKHPMSGSGPDKEQTAGHRVAHAFGSSRNSSSEHSPMQLFSHSGDAIAMHIVVQRQFSGSLPAAQPGQMGTSTSPSSHSTSVGSGGAIAQSPATSSTKGEMEVTVPQATNSSSRS